MPKDDVVEGFLPPFNMVWLEFRKERFLARKISGRRRRRKQPPC